MSDMPRPNKNEMKEDFIGRCMRTRMMVDNIDTHSQRKAVCSRLWNETFEDYIEE